MLYLASSTTDVFSGLLGVVIFFAIIALLIWAVVAFFRGPAKGAELYVDNLAMQIANPSDRALFVNLYRTSGPKNVLVAWLLTVFLSPTVSYLYQGKWALAIIALITFQGLLVWWIVSWFSMPSEVMNFNKRLADKAFNQLMINRPQATVPLVPFT